MTTLKGGIPIIGKVPQKPAPKEPGRGEKIARVDQMRKSVESHLNGIAHWFDAPSITLIVRANGDDMVFTNDTTAEAIAALQRHEKKVN